MVLALWVSVALAEPELSGDWRLAEEPAALAQTHAEAVDRAVASLPWLVRPMARPFLKNSVQNCQRLQLVLDEAHLGLTCDERPPLKCSRGSEVTAVEGVDGSSYAVALEVTASAARLIFTGERGGQKSHFRREGDALLLRKEIFSQHLPDPIVWEVRYVASEAP